MLRLPGGIVARNMERRVERAAEIARRFAPGSMGDDITSHVIRERGEITGYVVVHHPATIFVVSGTRPHIIRPVRAQALRFQMEGRTVFAKIVYHPGTRANNFLDIALRSVL